MKGCNRIFYTPENQYPGMPHGEMCGDIMPFYWNGKFIFIYLYKYCIYAVETEDFVTYGDHRLVLQNGTPQEQDWHAATGSVCRIGEQFYFYYTGFCEGNRDVEGKYEQAILRAVSNDLIHWEKDKDYFFPPDTRYFKAPHWRDPHVFYHEELQRYLMLVTACEKDGASKRSGCTAVYASDDGREWEFYRILYSPRTFVTCECQDVFRMGGRWYLTFSSYSRQWETRYRMAERFEGPYTEPPADDMFDGRQFYAAKTVTDGKKRYLVGWQSIRKDCSDSGAFVWGGNVIVHELLPRPDGTLGVKMPDTIRAAFQTPIRYEAQAKMGSWEWKNSIFGSSPDGFGWLRCAKTEGVCLLEAQLTWEPGTGTVGVMLHVDNDRMTRWCQLRLEIGRGRIVFDRYNRIDGDQYFADERPFSFQRNKARVQIIVSGNIVLSYVDDVALCARCYEIEPGYAGLFVEYGSLICKSLTVCKLSQ